MGMTNRFAVSVSSTIAVVILALSVGCAGLDPALRDETGTPIRELRAAPLVLAVAPVEAPGVVWPGTEGLTEQQLTREFLTGLRAVDACSDLVPMDSSRIDGSLPGRVDLVVVPKLQRVDYRYDGMAGTAAASIALWALTWIGGLFVPDSYYETEFVVDIDLYDPRTRDQVDCIEGLKSGRTKLSFFDRNDFVSLGTVEALVVPSVWTHDQEAALQESVSRKALLHVAAAVKKRLIERNREAGLEFTIEPPHTARLVDVRADVRIDVQTSGIQRVIPYLNGDELTVSTSGREDRSTLVIPGVSLVPGRNFLQLQFDLVGNHVEYRTVRWDVRAQAAPAR